MPEDCRIALARRGICVVIPTCNNAGTIADVVTRTQRYCRDVFVVLDGCTDDTLAQLEALPEKPELIILPRNRGKGRALQAGFRQAEAAGFAYAITLDADGQHYPEDIPVFLEANRRRPGALIVGQRMGLAHVVRSRGSRFANAFSNLWFFLQTLVPLKDTQTGYRLYPLRKLHGIPVTARYEAELSLLVFAAWRGVPVVGQDVRVYYPSREERVSHFRPLADFARIFLLNVALCLLACVYGLPVTLLRWTGRFCKSFFLLFSYAALLLLAVTPGVFLYLKCGRMTEAKKERLHGFICRFARFGTKVLGLFGNPYAVGGCTEEDFRRPAIIICNHQSHLDLLAMLALTPRLVVLTADWVWHNPLYGFIIREADFLPASAGLETIAPHLERLVAKGYSVAVYPESTRSQDGRIGRFHQGAFYLAERLGLDVLPLVLYGTYHALPKHGRWLRRYPIRLEIAHRVPRETRLQYGEDFRSQASGMRKYYVARYAEIADQVERTGI
ncbi:MAG: glycosyltransferase [Bacteroidales bacterium]|nr:glycosyltransferase [Bacteroidales bacterium]